MKKFKEDGKFTYVWVEDEDVDRFYKFLFEEYNKLENKDTFAIDAIEEVKDIVNERGFMLGVLHGDEIVALWYSDIPTPEGNFANDVDIFEINKEKVAHNNSSFVAEKYRGNKLQNTMRTIVVDKLQSMGYTEFMATVSPYNIASYKNIIRSGYALVGFKIKYKTKKNPKGLERYITLKSQEIEFKFTRKEEKIKGDNVDRAKELFKQRYIGVEITDDDMILFRQVD